MSLCPHFSLLEILVQYLVAFHTCHGELFSMHWFFVGTHHQTEQARWNNCLWKFCAPVPQLIEQLAAPFHALVLCELWHAAVACLNTRSYHKCSPESCKVCKFWCQIFNVSLEYIAKRLLFPFTTRSLRPQQDVLSECTVHKICCSVCQKSFVFSTVCHSLGCHGFQNEGIEECGRSHHVPLCLNKMECSTAPLWTNNTGQQNLTFFSAHELQ